VDLVTEIVRTVDLLAKITFDKNIGIEEIYHKNFFALIPQLIRIGAA
jgi:hypothetical protein